MSTAPSPIVAFYDPAIKAPDYKGRTLEAIQSWTNHQLEREHDYIQILFPLPEPSPHNHYAPLVDRTTFEAFRSRPELRTQVRRSFVRICAFFGFRMQKDNIDDPLVIVPISTFSNISTTWLKNFNHNHQRMTRIIRSLRILGLEEDAQAFATALFLVVSNNPGRIGAKSILYWTRVTTRSLYMAPDDEDGRSNPKGFLYEYEQEQQKTQNTTQKETGGEIVYHHPDVVPSMIQKKPQSKHEIKTKTNSTAKTNKGTKRLPGDKPTKNGMTKNEPNPDKEDQTKESTKPTGRRRNKPTPKVKKDAVKKATTGTSAKMQKPRKPRSPPGRPTRTQPGRSCKKDMDYK